MTEENGDLFGKIDALLGKRGPDALVDKGLERDDFPVLTDVVGSPTCEAEAVIMNADRLNVAKRIERCLRKVTRVNRRVFLRSLSTVISNGS